MIPQSSFLNCATPRLQLCSFCVCMEVPWPKLCGQSKESFVPSAIDQSLSMHAPYQFQVSALQNPHTSSLYVLRVEGHNHVLIVSKLSSHPTTFPVLSIVSDGPTKRWVVPISYLSQILKNRT